MIRIHSLAFQHQHGEFRLHVPELTVAQSEKVAVIGPSGSGKTTLLNLIAGIFPPGAGEICIGDVPVHQLTDAERRNFRITSIGFVFQDFELLDYLSVLDNIVHPYRITRALVLDKTVRARAVTLTENMGIGDKLARFPDELSQGEKQRAAICRALLPQPTVILADEATGNLDPDNKNVILDLLFDSVDNNDATLLAVTHDHELLSRFDRVIDFQNFRQEAPV
ncbi:MAG: ABC transporter ATP-binding protein [Nitrospirota bacterium]|nr:ABC transporter ATP-binding protein [Nitrospirota bacterium]